FLSFYFLSGSRKIAIRPASRASQSCISFPTARYSASPRSLPAGTPPPRAPLRAMADPMDVDPAEAGLRKARDKGKGKLDAPHHARASAGECLCRHAATGARLIR
ncbi:unnamed protein product, partial [Closterium sp. Naga37s-1]